MLDPKLIRRLARIMSGEGVTELEIEDKEAGTRLCLKRGDLGGTPPTQVYPMMQGSMPMGAPALAGTPMDPGAAGAGGAAEGGLPPGVVAVESPMVGTFYRSPSPESDPFVEVGASVDEERVICIVEAMKVMNEIKAEMKGEVVEFLVENGEPVEYGQPLLLVKKR